MCRLTGILLIHRADSERPPEYVAVSSLCTHARCLLGYPPHDQRIECPCHRSQFRAVADAEDPNKCAGSVIHKPARGGLTVWEARYDEQTQNVWIDLTSAVPPCGEDDPFPPLEGGEIRMQLSQCPKLGRAGGWVRGRPAG